MFFVIFNNGVEQYKSEVHLSLGIIDFEDDKHDDITQSLGIEPDKQFFRGKPLRKGNPKNLAKINVWRCNAPAVNSNVYASFDEQADTLFKLLNERKDALKVICDKYYCELSCGVYIYYLY